MAEVPVRFYVLPENPVKGMKSRRARWRNENYNSFPHMRPPSFSSYCISQWENNTKVVFLMNCLVWRSVYVKEDTFTIKKHSQHSLDVAATRPCLLRAWINMRLPLGKLEPSFRRDYLRPNIYIRLTLLREICFLLTVSSKPLATAAWSSINQFLQKRCSFADGRR